MIAETRAQCQEEPNAQIALLTTLTWRLVIMMGFITESRFDLE